MPKNSACRPPDHLAAAVLLLAILGGYQNRTHDPPPGHQIMWRGYERMSIATEGALELLSERIRSIEPALTECELTAAGVVSQVSP